MIEYTQFLSYDFQHDHIRDGPELPDVTLVYEEECQFQAHRVILDKNKQKNLFFFLHVNTPTL